MRHPEPRPGGRINPGPLGAQLDIFYFINVVIWISFFYLNTYIIIPYLYVRRRFVLFFITQVIFILTAVGARWAEMKVGGFPFPINISRVLAFNFFPYLFFLACSITFRLFLDKSENDKVMKEKETETLKTELSFLRSQISPHFMFNVLNNMVALARKKSDALEPSLIKLSSIMRYMLYEMDEEKVSLEKEVEYLQNYIDLQTQRFNRSVKVETDIGPIDDNYYVEPMLLIPLVENSFKHSISTNENGCIQIKLEAQKGELHFTVRNKFNPARDEVKDKTSGIGLENLQKRLQLLYKTRHQLSIQKNETWFTVSLSLNFN